MSSVLTQRRGRTLLITLNRPKALNAINAELADGLLTAVAELDDDPSLAVGVLTGSGERAFSAGMDLKAFSRGEDVRAIYDFLRHGTRKPMIAAVEGLALAGGLEMALACDLIVASRSASFGIPEVKVGLFASAGGVLRLPTRVGYAKAMEMALTGEPISAQEAADHGLVARLTEPGRAGAVALELADRIAANAPLAVATSKRLVQLALGMPEAEFWTVQETFEDVVRESADAAEGPRAFAEKRAPRWTGA